MSDPAPLTAEEEAVVRREAARGGLTAHDALRVFATLDAVRAAAQESINFSFNTILDLARCL